LCGLPKKLIKAHIVPRGLYKSIRTSGNDNVSSGEKVPRVYSEDEKPKQWQNGIFDKHILCGECDGLIGQWDQYGQKFLEDFPTSRTHFRNYLSSKSLLYEVTDFNYVKLKLFFLSILWRASITQELFFAEVKLSAAWEDRLKKMILEENPGNESDFSVILFHYEGELSTIMQNPQRLRQDSINYYRFRVPDYCFLIKVDQRKFPEGFERFILSCHSSFLVASRNFSDTSEYDMILKVRNQFLA
jgi:hypothetical protein